jgi:hypothetical protein
MGVRTRGLDIKAGAANLKAERAARVEAELVVALESAPGNRWPIRAALLPKEVDKEPSAYSRVGPTTPPNRAQYADRANRGSPRRH